MSRLSEWDANFIYDPSVPSGLRWKVDRWAGRYYNVLKASAGDPVYSTNGRGYHFVRCYTTGRAVLTHIVIWEMHNGLVPDGAIVDHIDGNSSNNSVDNLRMTTQRINLRNRRMQNNNTSGVTGVSYSARYLSWRASWVDPDGTRRQKWFRVSKYGEFAKQMAVDFRIAKLEELKELGEGYTDRHGKK